MTFFLMTIVCVCVYMSVRNHYKLENITQAHAMYFPRIYQVISLCEAAMSNQTLPLGLFFQKRTSGAL